MNKLIVTLLIALPLFGVSQDTIKFTSGETVLGFILSNTNQLTRIKKTDGNTIVVPSDKIKSIGVNNSKKVIVEGVNINALPNVKYCQLLGYNEGWFKKKIIISVDYGQEFVPFSQGMRITDQSAKPIVFNSMIDALNFMENNGWEYVNQNSVSSNGGGYVYHFLLKRMQ